MNAIKSYNWKLFFILLAASTFGAVAIVPYALTLQGLSLEIFQSAATVQLVILQLLLNAVMFGVVILAGLFLAKRIGLGLPILEAKLQGESVAARVKSILLPSILLGVLASVAIIALDMFVFAPSLMAEPGAAAEALTSQMSQPPAWQGFLSSFYGGINEEILMRLLLLSLLAWLGKFINHTPEGRPTQTILWTANILSAILFGLGHLPITSAMIDITPLVVVRAVLLNGLAGVVFGYLYWTRGLESAMLSHFSADLVLHVLTAL